MKIQSCRLARYALILGMVIIITAALAGIIPGGVYAQNELDLELGGTGATPWSISNIKPGDSGVQAIELHNAGNTTGRVTIWISDISGNDYGGDGAALGNYMLFSLTGAALTATLNMPAKIGAFPQTVTSGKYLRIDRLDAGETVDLTWEWEFKETGLPQNDAQGDSLSFTINYLLEEPPSEDIPQQPVPPYVPFYAYPFRVVVLGHVTLTGVSLTGDFLSPCIASDASGGNSLQFDAGTRVSCTDGQLPWEIEMRYLQNTPAAPDGAEIVGPCYEIVGYSDTPYPQPVTFSRPVKLTLTFDENKLPAGKSSINIGCYKAGQGWTFLDTIAGDVSAPGRVNALITRSAIFAVLAAPEVPSSSASESPGPTSSGADIPAGSIPVPGESPPSSSVTPATPQLSPPEFIIGGLEISPASVKPGWHVFVSVLVRNAGEREGVYILNLMINSQVAQSREVVLVGGESTRVVFDVNGGEPGTYNIDVNGLTGEYTVLAPEFRTSRSNILIWVLSIAIPAVGLLIYLFIIKPKKI